MKIFSKAINSLLIATISFQLIGCKIVKSNDIDNSLEDYNELISGDLELAQQVAVNQKILEQSEKLNDAANDAPSVKFSSRSSNSQARRNDKEVYRQSTYDKETKEIVSWIEEIRAELDGMVQIIKDLGRQNYENVDGVPVLSLKQIHANEMSIYYALTYLRNALVGVSTKTTSYLSKLDNSNLDKFETIDENRRIVLEEFLGTVGLVKIIENDIIRTLNKLKQIQTTSTESLVGNEMVSELMNSIQEKERDRVSRVQNALNDHATAEERGAIQEQVAKYDSEMAEKSILFNPNQPDHPLVHLLVIASNLSWGLINTLVGLGFVIVRVLLTPILGVPDIRISASRMQIYADVCGLGVPYSKMSAGLFELDYCTNYHFASDHEAGHAKQSALLGPLYFPAAILSYILVLGHGGFIEHWADAWSHGDGHSH